MDQYMSPESRSPSKITSMLQSRKSKDRHLHHEEMESSLIQEDCCPSTSSSAQAAVAEMVTSQTFEQISSSELIPQNSDKGLSRKRKSRDHHLHREEMESSLAHEDCSPGTSSSTRRPNKELDDQPLQAELDTIKTNGLDKIQSVTLQQVHELLAAHAEARVKLRQEKEKRKFLQKELEKVKPELKRLRVYHRDINQKYRTNVVTLREQVDHLQCQLRQEVRLKEQQEALHQVADKNIFALLLRVIDRAEVLGQIVKEQQPQFEVQEALNHWPLACSSKPEDKKLSDPMVQKAEKEDDQAPPTKAPSEELSDAIAQKALKKDDEPPHKKARHPEMSDSTQQKTERKDYKPLSKKVTFFLPSKLDVEMEDVSGSYTPSIELQAQAEEEGKKFSGTPMCETTVWKRPRLISGLKEPRVRKTYEDLRLKYSELPLHVPDSQNAFLKMLNKNKN